MATYTSFITNLANLTVTDVTRKLTLNNTPPASVDTADLPLQFVLPLGGTDNAAITFAGGDWPEHRATLVILINPVAQDTPAANYADAVDMVDNLNSALLAAHKANTICDEGISWVIRVVSRDIAGIMYWAVDAEVVSHGAGV